MLHWHSIISSTSSALPPTGVGIGMCSFSLTCWQRSLTFPRRESHLCLRNFLHSSTVHWFIDLSSGATNRGSTLRSSIHAYAHGAILAKPMKFSETQPPSFSPLYDWTLHHPRCNCLTWTLVGCLIFRSTTIAIHGSLQVFRICQLLAVGVGLFRSLLFYISFLFSIS